MFIFILLLTTTFPLHGTISWLGLYAAPTSGSNGITARIAGEVHDADPANQKKILQDALTLYASSTHRPITLHIEDPLAIPELSTLNPPRGLLLGLTSSLQGLGLPDSIVVKNFDTKKVANCAIHFFKSQPPNISEMGQLHALTFDDLMRELNAAHTSYQTHWVVERMGQKAQKDINTQLALTTSALELLQKNLRDMRVSLSDSMAQTAWHSSKQTINHSRIYQPIYDADVRLTSLAAIMATLESKTDTALVCGERHAKDVSRILELENWHELDGPCSFTRNWLRNPTGC